MLSIITSIIISIIISIINSIIISIIWIAGNQQDKSGYSHKPQLAPNYNKSLMSSMKQDELLREKSTEGRERSALDYRDKLSSQFSRSSYVSNEDSHHAGQVSN